MIERKQKEPSLMQCLTTWVVRSVDEVSPLLSPDSPNKLTGSDQGPGKDDFRAKINKPIVNRIQQKQGPISANVGQQPRPLYPSISHSYHLTISTLQRLNPISIHTPRRLNSNHKGLGHLGISMDLISKLVLCMVMVMV